MIKEVTYKEPKGYFNEAMRKADEEYDRKHKKTNDITYDEALKIAREHKDNINNCIEYETGYVFGTREDSNYIGGYGHTPVVILKADGTITSMPEFTDMDRGEILREFTVE